MANLYNLDNKFLVADGGNVLIGQTAVVGTSMLQVEGSTNAIIRMNSTGGTGGRIDLSHSGNVYGNIGSGKNMLGTGNASDMMINADSLLILGVGSQDMTIDGSGKIQVGSDKVIWAGGYGGGLVIRRNNATGDRLIKMVTVDSTGAIVNDNVLVAKGSTVGIGTASPGRKLTVTANASGDANNLLLSNEHDTNGDSASIGFSMLSNNTYVKSGIFFKRTTTQGRGDLIFATNNEVNGNNVTLSNARMTIQAGGIVQINTNVAKTSTSTVEFGSFGQSNEATNYSALQMYTKGGASQADRSVVFQTIEAGVANAGSIVLQPSGGKVGIGTNTPNKALTVYGGNDNGIWIDSQGAQYTSLAFGHNGTEKANISWDNTNGYTNISTYANGHLALSTGGRISGFLNSTGNFGVGDTAPTSISANTYSLSVNSTRNDLSGALVSKANGNVKHQQYWDSSGYSFNITANSGVFKFNGADVQVNSNIKAADTTGKFFSNTYSFSGVNLVDFFQHTNAGIWEYTLKVNPNTAGSGAYTDYYYGKIGVGIGWSGSNVTQYLWDQPTNTAPRSLYGSGGGNLGLSFQMLYNGSVYTNLPYNTGPWYLRLTGLGTNVSGEIYFRRLA